MKLLVKLFLIFTMFFTTVGEVQSSAVVKISNLYNFNQNVEICANARGTITYSPFNVGDLIFIGQFFKGLYYGAQAIVSGIVDAGRASSQAMIAEATQMAAKEGMAIVGEGMKRVSMEAAKYPGSITLNNMPRFTGAPHQITSQMMTPPVRLRLQY